MIMGEPLPFHLLKSKRFLLFGFIFSLFAYGFYLYAIKQETNHCEMTFMYQFPQFIPVPLRSNISKKFPNYNVYIYGEGEYAMFLREGIIYGIPVLFVPGSAGSYKQVRSFGSIALRIAEERLMPHHFNFFTIDFNEELSGLYGMKLKDQTEFLYESIEAIKKLYLKAGRNVSLIVIGHSIGGLISRGVYTVPNFDPSSVDLLITLATPHKQPALFIDSHMVDYYRDVISYWSKNRSSPHLKHLSIISIGGGFGDKLVKSELTQLPDLSPKLGDINLVTTAISDVWMSTDHQCIVWCRQLIVKLAKLIFELGDSKIHRVISDIARRSRIISYHLVNRNRGPSNNQVVPVKMKLTPKGDWITYDHRYFAFRRNKIIDATFLLMPLVPKTNVILLTSNIMRNDWIFGCNASIVAFNGTSKKLCETGENLSPTAKLVQKTFDRERKVFKQSADTLIAAGFSHLAVYIGPTVGSVSVIGERFSLGRRNKAIVMPTFLDGLFSLLWTSVNILDIPVAEEAVFYNLTLVGFSQIWHNYDLRVEVRSCYNSAFEYGLIQFWVPWSSEDKFSQIAPAKGRYTEMMLRLNVPKKDPSDTRHPHLYLMLDPNCGYVVKLNFSYKEALAQLIRHYFNSFLPFVAAILLSALSIQIIPQTYSPVPEPLTKNGFIKTRETFQPLSILLKNNFWEISIFFLLPLWPMVMDKLYKFAKQIWNIETNIDLINPFSNDSLSNAQQIFVYSSLYLFSYSLLFIISVIIDLSTFSLSYVFLIITRLFSQDSPRTVVHSSPDTFKLKIIPILITLVVFLLSLLTCSTFCLSALFSFLSCKLIYTSITNHLEESRTGASEKTTFRHLDTTFLLLLYIVIAPTIPTAVVWFRDYFLRNRVYQAFPDLHVLPTYTIAFTSSFFLHPNHFPCENRLLSRIISYGFKLLGLITLTFGLVAYNYITNSISISFVLYSIFRFSSMWSHKERSKQD